MVEEFAIIGKRLPKVDGIELVTGEARYAGDLVLPRMLQGRILRSPYPHARLRNIDASRAERLSGVRAVITGRDNILGMKYSTILEVPETIDKYPLAVDKVRYIGDEVAAVAAVDEEVAEEALGLIKVDYEELPAVFDPLKAMEAGAPLVHDKEANVAWEVHMDVGNVEEAFRGAYVREDRFATPLQAHCAMEPHLSVASYDPSGKLTVWSSSQVPQRIRMNLCRLLGLTPSKVRLIAPFVGGGFGGKAEFLALDYCTALLSMKTGRPVRIAFTRSEVFNASRRRIPVMVELKTGVGKDGRIVAQQGRVVTDNGAYNATGAIQICGVVGHLGFPYRIPNLKYDGYVVYTNNPITGPMRGHGCPEARFATESQLDMIAGDLGMDPVELRLRNIVGPGDELSSGWRVTSCGLEECIRRVAEDAGWRDKRHKMGNDRGIGMALYGFGSGVNQDPYDGFAAILKVHEDGAVTLLTGAVDIGQGARSTMAAIVAEEMGLGWGDVRVLAHDSEITPLDRGSYSSRVTFWSGNAVRAAAIDAKRQLLPVVAERLEAKVEDLEARNRRIYVRGSPERGMSLADAVTAYRVATGGKLIVGKGDFAAPVELPNLRTGVGNRSPAYAFGAMVAEVEVNRETGEIKVMQITYAHDCGRAINPMAAEGQLEGAVLMGLGFALSEDMPMDGGWTLNPSFVQYPLPLSTEVPPITSLMVESVDRLGPFGAKEAGEGSMGPVAAAVANAIADAVGIRIKELPITAEKLLQPMEKGAS